MCLIGFSYEPSVAVAYLDDEHLRLKWIHKMDKNHDIFQRLSSVKEFDYCFINDILIIPDPVPVAREKWNRKIGISELKIECKGKFMVFFNCREKKEGFVYADSLSLPQFEFLRSYIQWEK